MTASSMAPCIDLDEVGYRVVQQRSPEYFGQTRPILGGQLGATYGILVADRLLTEGDPLCICVHNTQGNSETRTAPVALTGPLLFIVRV